MERECPYCGARVDVARMVRHVRLAADDDHGPYGAVPERDLGNPWNLRLDFADGDERTAEATLKAEVIKEDVRRGRCPACELGVMALKGGDGILSTGPRRLACPSCGWESPEWIEVE